MESFKICRRKASFSIKILHIIALFLVLSVSTTAGRGCDPGLQPTIYDDNDCVDKNDAQTNLVRTQITADFIKSINKCHNVDDNTQVFDIIIHCNRQSLNFTMYSTSNNTCSGDVMYEQPYTWGKCYPSIFGHGYYMRVNGSVDARRGCLGCAAMTSAMCYGVAMVVFWLVWKEEK